MKNKNIIHIILIPLLLVVAVQICLKNPMTRELFTDIESYEDIDYGGFGKMQVPRLEIILRDGKPSEDIRIMFNSKEISSLDTVRVTIPVDCDGVVQIQNNSGEEISLHINYNPGLLDVSDVKANFEQGIGTLCKVRIY